MLAPLAMSVFSTAFSKMGQQDAQSYTPQEIPLNIQNPEPELAEPTMGMDTTDNSAVAAKKGKSALVIQRNPSVGISGVSPGGGSGVGVAKG